jgi:Transposase, Mutator family
MGCRRAGEMTASDVISAGQGRRRRRPDLAAWAGGLRRAQTCRSIHGCLPPIGASIQVASPLVGSPSWSKPLAKRAHNGATASERLAVDIDDFCGRSRVANITAIKKTTDEMTNLRALVEKAPDAEILGETIGFAAERSMEIEVAGLTGAGYGDTSPERLAQRKGCRARDRERQAGAVELRIPKLRQGSYFSGLSPAAPDGREDAECRFAPGTESAFPLKRDPPGFMV